MSGRLDRDRISLRIAEGAERRACRMLLPDGDRLGHLGDLLIATTAEPSPQVLGALSLLPLRDAEGAGGVFASARVVRTWRRRGVGTLLLEAAVAEARRLGAGSIVVQADAAASPEGAAFLAARGFAPAEVLTTFEVATDAVVAYLRPLVDRLRSADRIPPEARMVPLRDAPLVAVARLHAEHLAGSVRGVCETLNDLLARSDADDNAVLLIGEEVHGLLIGNTVDGLTVVDAEVLSPACRVSGGSSGWASVFMLAERLEWGLSRGSRITRFSCTSGNRPTRRLAQRLGARPIREEGVYRLRVLVDGGGWPPLAGEGDGMDPMD